MPEQLTEVQRIHSAWDEEGSIRRLGLLPAADKTIQSALIPSGGEWKCVAEPGDITRKIIWNRVEVALVNPRGDLGDQTEGDIAMGLRATPAMDKALRTIFVLAQADGNLDLIRKIARAAVDYVEQPAPRLVEPDDDEGEENRPADEADCPGHVASEHHPKVCARCGVHIDELRPPDDEILF